MRSLATLLLVTPFLCVAQQPAHPGAPAHPTPPLNDHAASLPVTHVSLYKNGVGFFEHTGHVLGDASVTIDFTTDQLNDVLQSLTAIDLSGGRISGAGYNSTTPLEEQLKTLPLALTDDMSSVDFYSAIRGSRVQVTSGTQSITGRLLSVEDRTTAAKSDDSSDDNAKSTTDRHFLTVVSDTGEVRTLELTPLTSVHLLDTQLHQDVTRYLQLLADNRSQGLRHLTLGDRGTGSREIHISYISAVPIWKSTYRILFTDKSTTATIQGWAVVDNTVGEDWNNVQLSLIAGGPQSFIQPLSDPIYSKRVTIPIAQDAQLTPQTFDSSIEDLPIEGNSVVAMAALAPGVANKARTQAHISGTMHGVMGSGSASTGPMSYLASPVMAAPPPPTYEESATASTAPEAKAAAFDDFFSYNLTEPVTIRKNESALVPILQAKITADPVTLVSANGASTSQPLRALWITNTTDLTLDRGSFTLIENGAFGGEGLLDPIHPNEKRLLSYAADQAVHVSSKDNKNGSRLTVIHANKGYLMIHHAETTEITYQLHNAAPDARTVLLEYPIEKGFTLDNDTPKPTETTATVYRFRIEVSPGKTTDLHIGSLHKTFTSYQLSTVDDSQINFFLSSTDNNPALAKALEPLIAARRKVADAQTALNKTNETLTELRADEDRQRANITALQNADKEARERFVHDLNKTEDAIAATKTEQATRTTALDDAKKELSNVIDAFAINETL